MNEIDEANSKKGFEKTLRDASNPALIAELDKEKSKREKAEAELKNWKDCEYESQVKALEAEVEKWKGREAVIWTQRLEEQERAQDAETDLEQSRLELARVREACYRPARSFGDKEPRLVCRECKAWKTECEKGTPYKHFPKCSIGKALSPAPIEVKGDGSENTFLAPTVAKGETK